MAEQSAVSDEADWSDADLAPDPDVRMVLRTVYLPPDVDDELRVRAFRSDRTKNDLIREAVTRWLSEAEAGAPAPAKVEASRRSTRRRPSASWKASAEKV